jgi:hypothetical protein
MSRVSFGDDDEHQWLYQQHTDAAINGRRGQAFIREIISALDALPAKRLAADVLVGKRGEVCAMGAVALARGVDTSDVDETDPDAVGEVFCIAPRLAMEIAYLNDLRDDSETDEQRYARMRSWAVSHIRPDPSPSPTGTCSWCMRTFTLRRGRVRLHRHNGAACPGARKPPVAAPVNAGDP